LAACSPIEKILKRSKEGHDAQKPERLQLVKRGVSQIAMKALKKNWSGGNVDVQPEQKREGHRAVRMSP